MAGLAGKFRIDGVRTVSDRPNGSWTVLTRYESGNARQSMTIPLAASDKGIRPGYGSLIR